MPSVAETGGGDFIVTWIECDQDHVCEILGQRFTLSGPADCPGDCNRDGTVTVDELLLATRAALGSLPSLVRRCLPADVDLDYRVSIDELVLSVRHVLEGCR